MQVQTALSMLQDHSIAAFLTPDGILATHAAGDFEPSDAFDDQALFEIDDTGRVDARTVCDWLGY